MPRPSQCWRVHHNQPVRASKVPVFYTNKVIESYASKPSTPVSLKHLINFARMGRNKGEKEEGHKLLKSGNFLRTELPTRLSHRLRDLQELPYVVASNPRMAHVYDLYLEAFEQIRRFPVIKTLEDNDRFCAFMQDTLDKHRVVIPELAIGVSEASPLHLPPRDLDKIMVRMLRSRISRRVITEQHIALTQQFRERQRRHPHDLAAGGKGKGKARHSDTDADKVGIVDTHLNAADVVRKCEELIKRMGGIEADVQVRLEGQLDDTFAYISEHLEFMLFEMIRNAVHATVVKHGADAELHPITVTIVHQPRLLSVRVSDEGGGLSPYGGLPPPPPPPLPMHGTRYGPGQALLPSQILPAHVESAQRLDIFSFSHMRRFYQHHAQQLHLHDAGATGATAAGTLDPSLGSSGLALDTQASPSANNDTRTTRSASPGLSKDQLTGIMALRTIGKLSGTVSEQLAESESSAAATKDRDDEEAIRDAQMKSGIGLPLAKMFAEYFSGGLELYTVQGHGSDAWLRVPKFGTESQAIAGMYRE